MLANIYPPIVREIKSLLPYGCKILKLEMNAEYADVFFNYGGEQHDCRFNYIYRMTQ